MAVAHDRPGTAGAGSHWDIPAFVPTTINRWAVAVGVGGTEIMADLVPDETGIAGQIVDLEDLRETVTVGARTQAADQAMPEAELEDVDLPDSIAASARSTEP